MAECSLECGRSGFDTLSSHAKNSRNAISLVRLITLRKSMGVKDAVLPDGQPATAIFTALAQMCDSKAKETEMDVTLLTENGEGRAVSQLGRGVSRINAKLSPPLVLVHHTIL